MNLMKYARLRCSTLFGVSKVQDLFGRFKAGILNNHCLVIAGRECSVASTGPRPGTWTGVPQACAWGYRLLPALRASLLRAAAVALLAMGLVGAEVAGAQAVSTTTVQGTVYLANGQPGAGTLAISWPAFTTAAGQAVAADSTTVTIAPDGFVSVNLAPNLGATPAGEYYTAVYYMSDGTTSTQYWVVPAAAQASLAQVQAQVMPAAQAVQAVSKAYVDQAIAELTESLLTASGGTLSGPLYLNGDPTQPLQAADKHYVDAQVATAVPLAGGNMTGALTTPAVNGVQAPAAGSAQTTLQAAMNAAGTNGAMEIPPTYAGTDTFTNPNGVRVTDLRTGGRAADGAQREGVRRGVRRRDGRHERAAGGDRTMPMRTAWR